MQVSVGLLIVRRDLTPRHQLTAAPELGPDTGQPVSVTQTHLPGETRLTASPGKKVS
jgi:hypothetical protein